MRGDEIVAEFLKSQGVSAELIPHARVDPALAEARALGVPPGEVAKTVVLRTSGGFVRALLPATERLDVRKAREAIEAPAGVRLATEEELRREYPEFGVGAVPPFGGARRDPVVVDTSFRRLDSVIVEAGVADGSVRLRVADALAVLGDPALADLRGDDHR
jgi:Ala-tRNA(Pro) deacylase